jgi:hypothetical protein
VKEFRGEIDENVNRSRLEWGEVERVGKGRTKNIREISEIFGIFGGWKRPENETETV